MRRFLPSTVSEVSRGGTANFRLRPHHQSILFGARQADQSGAGKEEEEEEEEVCVRARCIVCVCRGEREGEGGLGDIERERETHTHVRQFGLKG